MNNVSISKISNAHWQVHMGNHSGYYQTTVKCQEAEDCIPTLQMIATTVHKETFAEWAHAEGYHFDAALALKEYVEIIKLAQALHKYIGIQALEVAK